VIRLRTLQRIFRDEFRAAQTPPDSNAMMRPGESEISGGGQFLYRVACAHRAGMQIKVTFSAAMDAIMISGRVFSKIFPGECFFWPGQPITILEMNHSAGGAT